MSPYYLNEAPPSYALGLHMVLNFIFILNNNFSVLILHITRFTNIQITKKREERKKGLEAEGGWKGKRGMKQVFEVVGHGNQYQDGKNN